MSAEPPISSLELSALISSKICHDVIGPVGAIFNGLEVLEDDDDPDSREYALKIIKDFTQQASAKLEFARFAFGAAGSAGAVIDLGNAHKISQAYIGDDKHTLDWQVPPGYLPKDKVKLLLNMLACAITALPRGGTLQVMGQNIETTPSFMIRCTGEAARPPKHLADFIAGTGADGLDALTIQAYYTHLLATEAGMRIAISDDNGDVMLSAVS
ncbi:MAG: histidine phosphotransferase family protein [Pseudomonadota bacterium]